MSQRNATLFRRASKVFGVKVKHIKSSWKELSKEQKTYNRLQINKAYKALKSKKP